jgi:hypothetical protein
MFRGEKYARDKVNSNIENADVSSICATSQQTTL